MYKAYLKRLTFWHKMYDSIAHWNRRAYCILSVRIKCLFYVAPIASRRTFSDEARQRTTKTTELSGVDTDTGNRTTNIDITGVSTNAGARPTTFSYGGIFHYVLGLVVIPPVTSEGRASLGIVPPVTIRGSASLRISHAVRKMKVNIRVTYHAEENRSHPPIM